LVLVVVVLQNNSLGFVLSAAYKPDLILIVVLWAGLRTNPIPGMFFAFSLGILADLLSGSPTGLFAVIYCVVYVVCGFLNATLDIDRPAVRSAAAFGACLLAAAAVVIMRWLSGPVGFGKEAAQWVFAKSLITGLACLIVFPVVDRFWMGYCRIVGVR
jgi:rod shape-determining protein MreD